METKMKLSKQWIVFGAVAGIAANILFPILLLTSLPSYLEVFLAGIFGILFSLTGFAIHHLMKREQPTILTQIGAIFLFAAGFLFNIMLMVQLTFKGYLYHYQAEMTEAQDLELLNWIAKTVDPVHLGMQISNDFFIALAMIVFSIVMFNHRFFGKIWGITGIVIAILLLGLKCYAFPMTPYELGIPYFLGPLISFWFLAVCIQCLRLSKSVFEKRILSAAIS